MKTFLINHKNQIMAFALAIVFAFSLPITSRAEVQQVGASTFKVGYSQPPVSSNQGYFNVIWKFADGSYNIDTYYWSIVPYYSTTADDLDLSVSRMNINVQKDGILTFTPSIGTNMVGMCTVIGLGDGNNGLTSRTMQNLQFTTSTSFTIDYRYATDVYGYACYGNLGTVTDDWGTGESHPTFTVIYGTDSYLVDQLNLIHNQLSSILSAIYSIDGSTNIKLTQMINKITEIVTNTSDTVAMVAQVRAVIAEYGYELDKELENIYKELTQLHNDLLQSGSDDKNNTDNFAQNSDSQSSALDSLNEQNKMDKIDVDSASSSVDSNIDGNAIANYGVVLSSITGQGKVVQLMLIVLSVGLVSYVLFGKR